MKKILGLSVAALLVIALVGGGTWAFFQDTESSAGNALAAGTLDLTLDATNATSFGIGNARPGQTGDDYYLIKNIGSLDGTLDFTLDNVIDTESNGLTEYEHDTISDTNSTSDNATGGSTTTIENSGAPWTPDDLAGKFVTIKGKGWRTIASNTDNVITVNPAFGTAVAADDVYYISDNKKGEMGAHSTVRVWIDIDKSGTFDDTADILLKLDGSLDPTTSTALADFNDAGAWYAVADLSGKTWTGLETMSENDEYRFYINWKVANNPAVVNNQFQGDSVDFDLTFLLTQTPNT